MKLGRIVILLIAISLGLELSAQHRQRHSRSPIPNNPYADRTLNFGFILAANQKDFRIRMKDDFKDNDTLFGVQTWAGIGFTVGAISNLKLHKYWDLRFVPTFSFGARDLIYSLRENPNKVIQMRKEIESTMVDVPLELKWSGMRDRSLRPYVIGGLRYTLDLASNAKKKQQLEDDIVVKLKRDDLMFTIGAGFDFYLPYSNRIGVEIKMAFGLRDMLVRENNVFTNGIDRLTSRILQISINLEDF